jgi:hypothetical protein
MVPDETKAELCRRFGIYGNQFHFPPESFLDRGYAPPGGYVKDFGVIWHEERLHLFHIDGRPEERCTESGNEISFGHASTADLVHWVRHRMPVAVGDNPWDNAHVWAPHVAKHGGKFGMYYMAAGRKSPGQIVCAESDDLEVWTKRPEGPIPTAEGRDPHVRFDGDWAYLYLTSNHGGIEALKSRDMVSWEPCGKVILNPERGGAESCAVHPYGDGFVLWYNDYFHCDDPTGDFRCVYAFSPDPLRFDHTTLKVVQFSTPLPTVYLDDDWVEKRPIPVSMELVERGSDVWLVCYFRWHDGRFRLFFGELDWSHDPATVTEIVSEERLREVRRSLAAKSR